MTSEDLIASIDMPSDVKQLIVDLLEVYNSIYQRTGDEYKTYDKRIFDNWMTAITKLRL